MNELQIPPTEAEVAELVSATVVVPSLQLIARRLACQRDRLLVYVRDQPCDCDNEYGGLKPQCCDRCLLVGYKHAGEEEK